jgi:RNA polymerase sigma factor (sigma-70 family)
MTADVVSLRALAAPVTEPWSDEAVAAACSAGNPEAIGELFDRYEIPVTRFLSRLTGGGDVEDLVQSTFLEIVGQRAHYDGRSSVKTWLFAIATNIVRRHRRTSARHWKLTWTLSSVDPCGIDECLSAQLDARRDVERVRSAFASLSEKVRLAFILCEVEGLSAKEAGQILDANEVTVWKRVSDARKALIRASREGER